MKTLESKETLKQQNVAFAKACEISIWIVGVCLLVSVGTIYWLIWSPLDGGLGIHLRILFTSGFTFLLSLLVNRVCAECIQDNEEQLEQLEQLEQHQ